MRQLCWPLLAVVVVRFVLNPEVLKYPLGVTPIFNWILWGYGLSIAALVVGLRFLRPTGDERLCARPRRRSRCSPSCCSRSKCAACSGPTHGWRPTPASWSARSTSLVWGAFALAALWLARTAPRSRGAVGVAAERRAGRGDGAGRPGAARQSDLRARRCRPPADRQRPAAGLCRAGGDGGAGAALDRHRANRERGPARRGHGVGAGVRLCLARGAPPLRSRFRAAAVSAPTGWSSTSTRSSGCCSASRCWRSASCATRRRCGMPAWRWSASWSPRSS